ncbi:MAG: dihydropteroate synthase, partial [bacterium (Candidatus Ratteibacteria) CG23_combo_of_CG06-09_8_20_14_all_48_7]
APGCNATCGLSNVSNGTPEEMRPLLNRTYLVMLEKYGMNSAIVNAFEKELVLLAKKSADEGVKKLIRGVMEGIEPDMSKLTPEEIDYVKTAKVLLGHSLYSHSWLKL